MTHATQLRGPDPRLHTGSRINSRRIENGGFQPGDLPLHLDEWFGSKHVPRMGGLRLVESRPQGQPMRHLVAATQ